MSETLSSYPFDTISAFRRGGKRKAIQLTIMVCGRPGLGKSTFLNTICDRDVYDDTKDTCNNETGLHFKETTVSFVEPGGKLINLTIIDTPGFGSQVNCTDQCDKISAYIEGKFDSVLREETRIDRNKFLQDGRVHCCLYFIPNTGQGLEELDLKAMTALSSVVNVIPLISKSDTSSMEELAAQKMLVRGDLEKGIISVFDFGFDSEQDDDEHYEDITAIRKMVPFAASGSNQVYQFDDEFVRGREYPWGFARSDDPSFSDLLAIREVLFGQYLQDLKESTLTLYETYRTKILTRNARIANSSSGEEASVSVVNSTIGIESVVV